MRDGARCSLPELLRASLEALACGSIRTFSVRTSINRLSNFPTELIWTLSLWTLSHRSVQGRKALNLRNQVPPPRAWGFGGVEPHLVPALEVRRARQRKTFRLLPRFMLARMHGDGTGNFVRSTRSTSPRTTHTTPCKTLAELSGLQ
jgi:hypothetical protein